MNAKTMNATKMRKFLQNQEREQLLKERASLQMVVDHEARAIVARRSALKHYPQISAVQYKPRTTSFSAGDLRVQLAEAPAHRIRQKKSPKRTSPNRTRKQKAHREKKLSLQLHLTTEIRKSNSEPLSLPNIKSPSVANKQ